MKKFYYWDMARKTGWAESLGEFRKASGAREGIRVAHAGVQAPEGWEKREGGLACHPITRKAARSLRSLVAAL